MGETCRNCEYFLSSHFDKNVGVCTLENDICLVENAESKMMTKHEITMELDLKNLIAESREVAEALNKFADNIEQIEKKYSESQESEDKE